LGSDFFDVLDTIENPEGIYEGNSGESLAVREVDKGKFLVVAYRESTQSDGYVITAFFTKRRTQIEKKRKIWPS